MTFVTAVKTCFRKYCVFKGRACRSEYWYFELFAVLLSVLFAVVWGIVALPQLLKGSSPADLMTSYTWVSVISALVNLAILLPTLGVGTRRLHDTGRSGWWLFGLMALVAVGSALVSFAVASMASPLDMESLAKGLLVAGSALLIPVFPLCIVMLVWLIQKGTKGPNRYGEDPKRAVEAEVWSMSPLMTIPARQPATIATCLRKCK